MFDGSKVWNARYVLPQCQHWICTDSDKPVEYAVMLNLVMYLYVEFSYVYIIVHMLDLA